MALGLACCDRLDESYEYWERAYREHDSLTTWNRWPIAPRVFASDPGSRIMRRVDWCPGQTWRLISAFSRIDGGRRSARHRRPRNRSHQRAVDHAQHGCKQVGSSVRIDSPPDSR
jgi:hypothetical protein